ncbi:MAG TPA: hypothetical protein VGW57_11060 [Chthoniobacterales bacterium]|nr:hypothetical protein [Chthoniobacterales bacterium]
MNGGLHCLGPGHLGPVDKDCPWHYINNMFSKLEAYSARQRCKIRKQDFADRQVRRASNQHGLASDVIWDRDVCFDNSAMNRQTGLLDHNA